MGVTFRWSSFTGFSVREFRSINFRQTRRKYFKLLLCSDLHTCLQSQCWNSVFCLIFQQIFTTNQTTSSSLSKHPQKWLSTVLRCDSRWSLFSRSTIHCHVLSVPSNSSHAKQTQIGCFLRYSLCITRLNITINAPTERYFSLLMHFAFEFVCSVSRCHADVWERWNWIGNLISALIIFLYCAIYRLFYYIVTQ